MFKGLDWSGQECRTPICFGLNGTQACNGPSHGSCYLPNNCTCYSNWYGSQCQIPICYGLNGPAHGSCVSPNNCSCSNDNEWTGQQCEVPICYGLSGKDTCNGKGTCSSPNNCTCLPSYYGADCSKFDCFGIEKSFPNVCSNGKCTSPNNCSCSTGWIGKECETFTCFGLNGTDACGGSTHGICSALNNCTCANKEWTGQQCGLPVCFGLSGSSACSGGKGICLSPNTCTFFTGQQCETSPSPSASLRIVNSSKTIRYPGTPVFISFALFLLIA